MTAILGISAYYHDSAAALVVDGQIVAAAQEERFTRRKHDSSFPEHAIAFCLQYANLTDRELDYVAFYDKPLRKFERILENYLAFVPAGYRSFRQAIPGWLKQKLHVTREIRRALPGFKKHVIYPEHHQSHAASAFYPSPFAEAAVLTLDGVGEWATTCIAHGRDNHIAMMKEVRYPHSLGLLYSAFTYYLGFRVNSGEYKVMGLAPYGQPIYRDLILDHLIDLKADGSLRMDMQYFNYCQGLTMTSRKFDRLLGAPPRRPESPLTQRDKDLAASLQAVTEEAMVRMARHAHEVTQSNELVMAGGVALNCVGNGRILREGPFEKVWIQPAAGDAGGALGAALFTWHQVLDRPRTVHECDSQQASCLGPEFNDEAIAQSLAKYRAVTQRCTSDDELCTRVAELIDQGQVVGWFQGRMEFGPRALGGRSILADARQTEMQSILNQKIKFRESFRPFAPMVLREAASSLCQWSEEHESPYMLFVAPMLDRSAMPSVTHVDGSARLQTIDAERQPLVYRLLKRFQDRTGCPAMINTSFNVRGEPPVCTPADAYRCFMLTDMDALAIGHYLLLKGEQPQVAMADREKYLQEFELD